MYNDVIGIVGGMGSYATLAFFERLLDAFPAEKEWDRPRIIIDNRCTMPSRVRAILYGEKEDELSEQLTDSVEHLLKAGATKIILACNTSHYFLPHIYQRLPEAEGKIISIIDATVEAVSKHTMCRNITLLASEGTIDTKIFHQAFEKINIEVQTPTGEQYSQQRSVIEDVKQCNITNDTKELMGRLINSAKSEVVIIGCTEFPVVFSKIDKTTVSSKIVVDPLQCVIDKLVKELV